MTFTCQATTAYPQHPGSVSLSSPSRASPYVLGTAFRPYRAPYVLPSASARSGIRGAVSVSDVSVFSNNYLNVVYVEAVSILFLFVVMMLNVTLLK